MRLIDRILSEENIKAAIKAVKRNKGVAGIDKMPVEELEHYFYEHGREICDEIRAKKYKPQPVRRVYIPKPNGKQRPLGIPTVADGVIQQSVAQRLMWKYEPIFSDNSYGFRPNRDCHGAMKKALEYLNKGYEWIIDLDIEKYFDTINHDKLISILREQVNESEVLHLIRSYLKAGVMENGLVSPTDSGAPQGGSLSPIFFNIYLDKLDKELESRGLRFVRYADDCNIFVKSEKAAERVMKSVTNWLERKLFLKVNASKTKITRPGGAFLGFGYWKSTKGWECKPLEDRKKRLYTKCKAVLVRKKAAARPLPETIRKLNEIIRGWINYYRIGSMKLFIDKFGQWLRHKVRVVIVKQWKKPKRIYLNLQRLNRTFKCKMTDEDIYKVANTRLGLYKKCAMNVINYLLSPKVLAMPNRKRERPGLIDPLAYYLS